MVGFAGDDAPRAVFSFLVVRPEMLGIMAGMDQMHSFSVFFLQGHQHPCPGAEADSNGPDCSADH